MIKPPGVYAPQRDTRLLARALRRETLPPDARVLDVGTGPGTLALLAARVTEPVWAYLRSGVAAGMVVPDASDPHLDHLRVLRED